MVLKPPRVTDFSSYYTQCFAHTDPLNHLFSEILRFPPPPVFRLRSGILDHSSHRLHSRARPMKREFRWPEKRGTYVSLAIGNSLFIGACRRCKHTKNEQRRYEERPTLRSILPPLLSKMARALDFRLMLSGSGRRTAMAVRELASSSGFFVGVATGLTLLMS